jgi:hypothetical protein
MMQRHVRQLEAADPYTLILMDEGVEVCRIETFRSLVMLALPVVAIGMRSQMKKDATDLDREFRLTRPAPVPMEWFELCLRRLLEFPVRRPTYWPLFDGRLELMRLDRAQQLEKALLTLYVLAYMDSAVSSFYDSCFTHCFDVVLALEPGSPRLTACQNMYEVFESMSPDRLVCSMDLLLHYGLEELCFANPGVWNVKFLRAVLTYAFDIKAADGTPFVPLFWNDASLTYKWLLDKQKDGSLEAVEQRWLSLLLERHVLPLGASAEWLLSISDHRASNEGLAQLLGAHLDMWRGKLDSGTVRAVYHGSLQNDHKTSGLKRSSDFNFYGRTVRVLLKYVSARLTVEVRVRGCNVPVWDHYRVTVFYFDTKGADSEVTFWSATVDEVTHERRSVEVFPVEPCPRGGRAGHVAALLWVQVEYSVVKWKKAIQKSDESDSDDDEVVPLDSDSDSDSDA